MVEGVLKGIWIPPPHRITYGTVAEPVLGGNTQKDQGAVAFKVGISKDKAKQCATAIAAKKGEKISFEESGKLIALKKKDGDTNWLAWLDGGIILAVPDKGGDKGALEALVANKTPVTGNGSIRACWMSF